jgi:chaperonin GroES
MMHSLKNLEVVGDRVLIRPMNPPGKTGGGLYLPPSVTAKDEVQSGIIVKVGPGYPVPATSDYDEYLKEQREPVQYIPLQAKEGTQALYLQKAAHEIQFGGEKYVLVNQAAILLLVHMDIEQELDM